MEFGILDLREDGPADRTLALVKTELDQKSAGGCAMDSMSSAPGNIGWSGKWSCRTSSLKETHLTPLALLPGSNEVILSSRK